MPGQKYPPVAVILGSRESQAPAYGLENSAAVRALQNLTEVLIVRVAEGQDPLADRLVGRVASLLGREYTTTHTLFSSAKPVCVPAPRWLICRGLLRLSL